MYKVLFLSPMIPSDRPMETAAFFGEALGFNIKSFDEEYHICERDGMSVHIQPAGENIGEMSIYIEVDHIDGLWTEMEPKVAHLRHNAPFDRPYGMREVHVDVPATKTMLFLGQSL